jgi:hypothetical protein
LKRHRITGDFVAYQGMSISSITKSKYKSAVN